VKTPRLMLALVLAVLVVGPFLSPAEAHAKSFSLPKADVVADVQSDGSVLITEHITYDFSGSFEGGYREIPLKDGMSVSDVSVSENGTQYAPGASAKLGSSGAPDTFGTANLGNAYRIVWHYRAKNEDRTFTVRYRLSGLAVAYDDVVDVYWQAWGDEWQEPLDSLDAAMTLPGEPQARRQRRAVRAVRRDAGRVPEGATLFDERGQGGARERAEEDHEPGGR
jgi:uncharacterized membrane protein